MTPPPDEERGTFRRNVIIIAALHVAVIGGLWLFSIWKTEARSGENVAWLDGGGLPVDGQVAQPAKPAPTAEDTPEDDDTPSPTPPPKPDRMATPAPQGTVPPSQIVIPAPTVETPTPMPEPTATPTPRPTPRPTPKPTPEDTPEPTPKPKPKPKTSPKPKPKTKPKPKASASPKKHASPKPSPHKSPTDDQDDGNDDDNSAAQARKAAFKAATGHASASHTAGGGDGEAGTAPGSGGGHRGGKGHAGGGATESDFGWYNAMLHDRFTNRWDQPTSIVTSTTKLSALVKITIEKDGTISDVSLAQSSGNDVMDQSVMDAARKVTQVDPLPEGLGNGGAYEVKINFELSQQSQ
jgi:TonB family protein